MADSLFRMNPNLPAVGRQMNARVKRCVDRIFAALKKWAQEWSRRAARVTPVETGTLRRSYFVIPIRNGSRLTVILANHMKYGKWLEFGTEHIAHGAVLAWQYGQPVIRTWPAKMADLKPPSARAKPTTHDRFHARLAKAMGPGAEQMPFVRPTGHELVPLIIADVQRIVDEELGRAA